LQQRYRRLLDTTSRVVGQAKRFSKEISEGVKRSADILQKIALEGLRAELDRMMPLVRRVMQQARVLRGDTHQRVRAVGRGHSQGQSRQAQRDRKDGEAIRSGESDHRRL
jgi:hypothetical protein